MEFFSSLFSILNERKIVYAVLRNYENLPQKPLSGSDIDLLVKASDKDKYLLALKEVIKKTGCLILDKSDRKNCLSFLIYQKDQISDGIWLDAFWEISSKSFKWADTNFMLKTRDFDEKRAFFVLSKGCEAATLFVKEVFSHNFIKDRYKSKISDFISSDKEKFIVALQPFLSRGTIKEMADICENGEWEKAVKKRKFWFFKLVLKSFLKRPLGQTINFLTFIFGYYGKLLRKRGVSIVLAGPDGVGKTVVCEELESNFKNLYFKGIYKYHGHFGFFPEWGRIYRFFKRGVDRSQAEPRQEKKVNIIRGILSLLYYGLEHVLAWPWILWLKFKGNLIIFDRYFYDFAVMNSSSNFPVKIFWLLTKFVHRPDMLFVLRAQPETVFERKKELSLGEIKRQDEIFSTKQFLKLAPSFIINAEEPIESVSFDIKEKILNFISKKQA